MGTLKEDISVKAFGFSPHKIRAQMAKIFESENFRSSETLKTFLSFIIEEKLAGRENQLKEYTIAIEVLHKSASFKPQENCIVRIHAVRLRKALAAYYGSKGMMDEIRISLPKGSYVPQFSQNIDLMLSSMLKKENVADTTSDLKPFHIAVIPFHNTEASGISVNFADGLAVLLSSALMLIKDLSVISYNMIRRVPEQFSDIKSIAGIFDTDMVITGDVYFQKNLVRVTVQAIRTDNFEQVWSMMLENKVTASTVFNVQDKMVEQISNALKKEERFFRKTQNGRVIMAVA